jgi:hypothetical protein
MESGFGHNDILFHSLPPGKKSRDSCHGVFTPFSQLENQKSAVFLFFSAVIIKPVFSPAFYALIIPAWDVPPAARGRRRDAWRSP